MTTDLQSAQQDNRDNGRYRKGPECEACGRPAGFAYYSDDDCNKDGIGLVLCGRKSCDGEAWVKKTRAALDG